MANINDFRLSVLHFHVKLHEAQLNYMDGTGHFSMLDFQDGGFRYVGFGKASSCRMLLVTMTC